MKPLILKWLATWMEDERRPGWVQTSWRIIKAPLGTLRTLTSTSIIPHFINVSGAVNVDQLVQAQDNEQRENDTDSAPGMQAHFCILILLGYNICRH
jgi:hypothetical protein